MNWTAQLLPETYLWASHLVYVTCLSAALWQAPWYHLKDNHDSHVFYASCIILWLFWRISAGVTPGMEFHLLLVTTVTLMFGWPFAIIAVSLAQLVLTIEGNAAWMGFSMNALLNGAIPVFTAYAIHRLVLRWLPRHFFIYIFVTAFFGSAVALLASRLSGLWLLIWSGAMSWSALGDEPMFILVMLFPEAFLNGLLMTMLVVYRPQWVNTFHDQYYLHGK